MLTPSIDQFYIDILDVRDTYEPALSVHEFPFTNKNDIENLGQKTRKITVNCVFQDNPPIKAQPAGKNLPTYENHFDFLQHIKNNNEEYKFTHPVYGELIGQIANVQSTVNDTINYVEITFTFFEIFQEQEVVTTRFPTDDTAKSFRDQTDDTRQEIEDSQKLVTNLVQWRADLLLAKGQFDAYLTNFTTPANSIINTIHYASDLPSQYMSSLNGVVDRIVQSYVSARDLVPSFLNNIEVGIRAFIDTLDNADDKNRVQVMGASRLSYEAALSYEDDEKRREEIEAKEKTKTWDVSGQKQSEIETLTPAMSADELETSLGQVRSFINEAVQIDRENRTLNDQAKSLQDYVNRIKLERDRLKTQKYPIQTLHEIARTNGLSYQVAERILQYNPQLKNPTFTNGDIIIPLPPPPPPPIPEGRGFVVGGAGARSGVPAFTGETGIQGPPGPQGATGVQGVQGETGIQGDTGVQGIQGETGVQGIQGETGISQADLDFAGDTGIGAVDLDTQTLTIEGTANEIETSAANQELTVGLPDTVIVTTSLGVGDTPGTTLDVSGPTNSVFRVRNDQADSAGIYMTFGKDSGNDQWYVGQGIDTIAHNFEIYDIPNTEKRLVINANGDVGIGSEDPTVFVQMRRDLDAAVFCDLYNNYSTGTDAFCAFRARTNTSACSIYAYDDGYTTNSELANKGLLFSSRDLYLDAFDESIRFYTGGFVSPSTFAAIIDSTGNVGIGTTEPDAELHVEGDIVGIDATSNLGSASRRWANLYMASTIDYETDLEFVSTSERVRFTTAGDVGIGGIPLEDLEVMRGGNSVSSGISCYSSAGANTPSLILRKSNSNTVLTLSATQDGDTLGNIIFRGVDTGNFFDNGAYLSVVQNGAAGTKVPADMLFFTSTDSATSEAMRIDKDSNVGIGTDAPEVKLHVVESDAGATSNEHAIANFEENDHCMIQVTSPNDRWSGVVFGDPENSKAGQIAYNHLQESMNLLQDGTKNMVIRSDGDIGVNTETPFENFGGSATFPAKGIDVQFLENCYIGLDGQSNTPNGFHSWGGGILTADRDGDADTKIIGILNYKQALEFWTWDDSAVKINNPFSVDRSSVRVMGGGADEGVNFSHRDMSGNYGLFVRGVEGNVAVGHDDPFRDLGQAGVDFTSVQGIHIEAPTDRSSGACLILEDLLIPNGSQHGAHIYMGSGLGFVELAANDTNRLLIGGTDSSLAPVYGDHHFQLSWQSAAVVNHDFLTMRNKANAASMTDTRTSIAFEQFYYDVSTPNNVTSGKITVGTEGNWTSTADTQDSYMSFSTTRDGVSNERVKIDSGGQVGIGGTALLVDLDVMRGGNSVSQAISCYSSAANIPSLTLRKSDNNSIWGLSTTQDGDTLGTILFKGVDTGNFFDNGAYISGVQNGAAGTKLPTDIVFYTSSSTTTSEVGRFTNKKTLDMGNNNIHGNTADVADDNATSFTPAQKDGMMMIFCMNTGISAIISYSVFSGTAYCNLVAQNASAFEVTTGILTGTTGTNGKFTISYHTDNKIYLENRLGSS